MKEHEVYEVVEHDGGWTYRVGGTFAETYRTREAADAAARHAAGAQGQAGRTESISFEDEKGGWHRELARGDDRPKTEVKP